MLFPWSLFPFRLHNAPFKPKEAISSYQGTEMHQNCGSTKQLLFLSSSTIWLAHVMWRFHAWKKPCSWGQGSFHAIFPLIWHLLIKRNKHLRIWLTVWLNVMWANALKKCRTLQKDNSCSLESDIFEMLLFITSFNFFPNPS